MQHGWFVVRNRIGDEDASFDLDEAEATLFGEAPWSRIPSTRRGSQKLRDYLGGLLCEKIRKEFPAMQQKVKQLLGREMQIKSSLGEPRDDHNARLRYLIGIVEEYRKDAVQALERPWNLPEETTRLRSIVSNGNKDFDNAMMSDGHTYEFEEPELEYPRAPSPATSQPGFPPTPEGSPQPKSKTHGPTKAGLAMPPHLGDGPQTPAELRTEIRRQIYNFQSSQLPGLLNPDIFPVLYRTQTRKWGAIARQHVEFVAQATREASLLLLGRVFRHELTGETNATHERLADILLRMNKASEQRALEELQQYCGKEGYFPFFTTNPEFARRLEENRRIRFKNHTFQHFKMLFEATQAARANTEAGGGGGVDSGLFDASLDAMYVRMHPSTAHHTEDEAHDILKAYYEVSITSKGSLSPGRNGSLEKRKLDH